MRRRERRREGLDETRSLRRPGGASLTRGRPPALQASGLAGASPVPFAGTPSAGAAQIDTLASWVLVTGDELLQRFPRHERSADLIWRQGQLALAHGWFLRAAEDFARLVEEHREDARAPYAAVLKGDALFRSESFAEAGAAYEAALPMAEGARLDSLVKQAARAIPISFFRDAEQAVARDSTDFTHHAALFENVASRWPEYEHAHLARYRAGLAAIAAGEPRKGIALMEALIERFPESEYVKDAHLQIARTWKSAGDPRRAGEAYAAFADRYPSDDAAGDAMLEAADLFDAAGLAPRAETQRLAYIEAHPDDVATAIELLEGLARREIAALGERPISSLLPARAAGGAKVKPSKASPRSHLARYLDLAATHPDLAGPGLVAEVRYWVGEERRAAFMGARLTLPLDKSIAAKQVLLDSALVAYRRCVDTGVPTWAHAATVRIGEALVGFGDALRDSERPADLAGDDRIAYDDVLLDQAQAFDDRGTEVWSELLRTRGRSDTDEWIERARELLWKRLADRFFYRPEVEFPLVQAKPPSSAEPGVRAFPHAPPNATPTDAEREGDE